LGDDHDPDIVTAIAKCGSTLEMFEWKAEDGGEGVSLAVPFLERILQVYVKANYHLHRTDNNQDDIEMQDASRATSNPDIGKVKEMILRDIPLSAVQCEAGWRDICAFVLTAETGQIPGVPGSRLGSSAVAFRPSAIVRLDVWKRILEGSILQNIDLERQFLVKDLWTALYDDGEAVFPYALFEAVTFNLMELQSSEGRCNPSGFKCKHLFNRFTPNFERAK
jgi:sister chromatid cohesion protein DCC1